MRRYVWREGGLVELNMAPPEPQVHLLTDAPFEGLQSTDGVDISSRTKHRWYMQNRGLTLAADFTETWAGAEKRRNDLRENGTDPRRKARILEAMQAAPHKRDEIRQKAERAGRDFPKGDGLWR